MEQVRPRLEAFAARMLGGLSRADQRAKGELYLRGLLLDGKRKSMQPMAGRLGVDHQQLQQFVTSSTWDYGEVRRRVARWADEFVVPQAYVIDDTGFPKGGAGSPGVARMYSGTLGKTGNCQIRSACTRSPTGHPRRSTGGCSCRPPGTMPLLGTVALLRRSGGAGPGARSPVRCGTGKSGGWRWTCSMRSPVRRRREAGDCPRRPVTADAGYGEITAFRLGLEARGLPYVVAVKAATSAYLASAAPQTVDYTGRGRPPVPRYRDQPASLRALVLGAGRKACRYVTWRHGTKKGPGNRTAAMRSRFTALQVRPANRDIPRAEDGTLPERWLIAEWHTAPLGSEPLFGRRCRRSAGTAREYSS